MAHALLLLMFIPLTKFARAHAHNRVYLLNRFSSEYSIQNGFLSPSRRREAPCEGTNSPRLFTPGEREALAMTSQTAPDWQLQIGESGASSRYNFNLELERLVCKQTALAA